jgi:hypothetical protein
LNETLDKINLPSAGEECLRRIAGYSSVDIVGMSTTAGTRNGSVMHFLPGIIRIINSTGFKSTTITRPFRERKSSSSKNPSTKTDFGEFKGTTTITALLRLILSLSGRIELVREIVSAHYAATGMFCSCLFIYRSLKSGGMKKSGTEKSVAASD